MTTEELNEILTDLVGNWSRASDLQGKFDAINQARSALATMTSTGLAQKILELIEQAEQDLETSNASVRESWQKLDLLKEDIKELCSQESEQGEVNIDWQEYARQLYETLDGVLTLFIVGNGSNYDYTCVQKALELFKRGHQWFPLTLAFAKKIEEEQRDPTTTQEP